MIAANNLNLVSEGLKKDNDLFDHRFLKAIFY